MSEKSDLRERAELRDHARKIAKCIYLATDGKIANDVRDTIYALLKALDDAEREERERCAVVARQYNVWDHKGYLEEIPINIAAAIRRD